MKKKFTIEFNVPVIPIKKDGTVTRMPVRYNVEGCMQMIRRSMPSKNHQEMLDEYAKFWLFKKAGIEVYPLETK